MPGERLQLRILFRDFLARMVDLELLSSGGDSSKLLGQLAALLAAFSLTFVVAVAGKYMSSAVPAPQLAPAAQSETEFLFATTMAIAGVIAVLVWNKVLPDARDCAILGVLPVRRRTIFLARTAAIVSVIGAAVIAINAFTGLCYPFLLLPPGADAASAIRGLFAYWLAMAAMGLFVCCSLLAVQGVATLLLSRRLFARFSTWIQLAGFFAIVGTYFLKPPLKLPLSPGELPLSWVPSFWFYSLFRLWNGTGEPALAPLAARAIWCLIGAGAVAACTFTLAVHRGMRRMIEEPGIAMSDSTRAAGRLGRFLVHRLFAEPLDRAIVLFTARTLARSRQHRLLLAAFGGLGLAIALVYAKDMLYGYSGGLFDLLGVNGDASRYWDRVNIPFLLASLILLAFAVIGVRAVFALPVELRANWIFRTTLVHEPFLYFSAVRKALFTIAVSPLWTVAALIFILIWPASQAVEHLAILATVGVLLAEFALHRFQKIPFACSYLPGKANLNVRLGVYAMLCLLVADRGVAIEYWAMQRPPVFLLLLILLAGAALLAWRRTAAFAKTRGLQLHFEDLPPSDVVTLDLRDQWNPSPPPVSAAARPVMASGTKPRSPVIGMHLSETPRPALTPEPSAPAQVRFEQLARDLRDGVRTFRRAPGFSAVTVILIALGLGANLTIYSIVHTALSKPAPGVRADGLVMFGASIDGQLDPGGPSNSYPNYLDFAAQTKTLSPMTASIAAPWLTMTVPDGTYEVRGEMVAANYFQTLGVPLVRGRTFTDEESRGVGGLVAVIAYQLWQNQFHGMEDIVGQHIVIDGHAATIVGVAAQGFRGVGLLPRIEIGLPIIAFSRARGSEARLLDRNWRDVTVIGRLASGASLSQAKAEIAGLSAHLRESYPGQNRGWDAVLAPYSMTAFGPNSSPLARRLMAAVSLIGLLALLVVCANIASLLLGRSVARERDIAVRLSLGATGGRIIRMLVAEGLMLSLTACLAAWPLTIWVTRTVGKLAPALESGNRFAFDLSPDLRVLIYGIALAILTTLAFTLAPAANFWRRQAPSLAKAAENSVARGSSRFLNTLVVGQVALCAILVTAGALAYQSLFSLDRADLFFTKAHLLLANINTAGAATGGDENVALLERVRERLLAVPGVTSVSYATAAPPHDHGWMSLPVEAADSQRATLADGTVVGPDYIAALGVPNLAGRDFARSDVTGARPAAIINRKLADEMWPGQSALGRTILLFEDRQPVEVVGVVPNGAFSGVTKDGAFAGVGKSGRPNFVFLSGRQYLWASGQRTLHIRYAGALETLTPEIRAAVRDVDGRVPVFSLRTMDDEFADFTAPIRIVTIVVGIFAASALLLSSVGLYAAIAFQTARRTREFGIRAALGGTPWQVLRHVLRQGLILTAAGTALGLLLAASFAGSASGLLLDVDPTDKATYLAVIALLTLTSLAACYIPARRAARVDPMFALRQD